MIRGNIKILVGTLIISVALFYSFKTASAVWQEPVGDPPSNNIVPPLYKKAEPQEGPLNIKGVSGKIEAEEICLCDAANCNAADCKSDWDAVSGFWSEASGNLYYDSGNVGIGTNDPHQLLHVEIVGGNTLQYVAQMTNNNAVDTGGSAVGMLFGVETQGYAKGALVYERKNSYARGNFYFLQNSSTSQANPTLADAVMTIQNNGNVGIGTKGPNRLLHIYKDSGDNAEIDIQSVAGTDNHWGIYNDRLEDILVFWKNGYNRVIFTPDGNVGIGVSPSAQLEITKSLRIPKTTSSEIGVIYSGFDKFIHNYGTNNTFLGVNAGNLSMSGEGNTAVGKSALDFNVSGSYNTASGLSSMDHNSTGGYNVASGYLSLWSNTTGSYNAAVGTGALALGSTGQKNTAIGSQAGYAATGSNNVFIGYDVGHNETGSDKLYIDNSSTVSPLIYGDFATDVLKVNGKLGVGVNPSTALQVAGTVTATAFVGDGSGLTGVGSSLPAGTTGQTLYYNGSNWAASSNLFQNGANVGTGTASPQAKLHVLTAASSSITPAIRMQNPNGFGPVSLEFWSDPQGSSSEWRPGYIASGDNGSGTYTGRLDFYTNGTGSANKTGSLLTMSIANGNVGIGKTAPEEKMEIVGSARTELTIQGDVSSNWVGVAIKNTSGLEKWFIGSNSNNFVLRRNAATNDFAINETGNIGIGTTSPSKKLTIVGSGDYGIAGAAMIGLENTVSGNKWGWLVNDLGEAALVDYTNTGAYRISVSPSFPPLGEAYIGLNGIVSIGLPNFDRKSKFNLQGNMTVGANFVGTAAPANGMIVEGNVGIGLTNPSAKFHITDTNKKGLKIIPEDDTVALVFDKRTGGEYYNLRLGWGKTDVNGDLNVSGDPIFQADVIEDGTLSVDDINHRRYDVRATKAIKNNTIPLNMTIMRDLCQDQDGCYITIGMRDWDPAGSPGVTGSRGPYKFFMSQTSDKWRMSNFDSEGKDGDGIVTHIIEIWSSCYFTDGEYVNGVGSDSSLQLGFMNWDGDYRNANMVCTLSVDD